MRGDLEGPEVSGQCGAQSLRHLQGASVSLKQPADGMGVRVQSHGPTSFSGLAAHLGSEP